MSNFYLSSINNQKPTPMLPLETDTLIDDRNEPCIIDQFIDNECFCTNYNPNSQPMTSNEFANKTILGKNTTAAVNKSYELSDNVIQESYFETNGMENADEFISDYVNGYPNGVILVLNETEFKNDAELFTSQLNSKLKHIIVCGNNKVFSKNNLQPTHSKTLKSAAKTAYEMATNGQAILFQGVNKNFDLFSYIY